MKMKTKFLSAALASTALMTASTAIAQDAPAGWTGEASLTGSQTTGNTNTTDVGLAFNIQNEGEVWRHTFRGSADFGRANGENNKERYTLGYQIDRDITDRLYAFGNADWYNDDFGAFENGYFVGGGLGYKLVQPAPWGWDVEGGAGFRSQQPAGGEPSADDLLNLTPDDLLDITDPDRDNEFALRGASKITYDFNDNVSFYNNSEVIWSASDTYLWNEFGLTAQLTGNLAARGSIRLDHHTDVLPGVENTDTITRFGLVYAIK